MSAGKEIAACFIQAYKFRIMFRNMYSVASSCCKRHARVLYANAYLYIIYTGFAKLIPAMRAHNAKANIGLRSGRSISLPYRMYFFYVLKIHMLLQSEWDIYVLLFCREK